MGAKAPQYLAAESRGEKPDQFGLRPRPILEPEPPAQPWSPVSVAILQGVVIGAILAVGRLWGG